MQANKLVGEIDWDANLRALYYDLAGAHSPEVIRMMLTITSPDHLLYGSDYPYVAPQVLTQSLARTSASSVNPVWFAYTLCRVPRTHAKSVFSKSTHRKKYIRII